MLETCVQDLIEVMDAWFDKEVCHEIIYEKQVKLYCVQIFIEDVSFNFIDITLFYRCNVFNLNISTSMQH